MKVLGIGNTAEVYEYGEEKVCKLFKEGYPKKYVKMEFQNAQILNKLALSAPKVYEIIEMYNRTGIIYEKINGKSLMNAIFEEKNTEMLFGIFTDLQKRILKENSLELLSYKDFLIGSLKGKFCENHVLKEKILALPEGNSICHGDFHPGNIILTPDNTAIIIDFMNVCRGRWEYDVARTYFLLKEFSDNLADSLGEISISDLYLEQMNVKYWDIEQWVEIVAEYRRYE